MPLNLFRALCVCCILAPALFAGCETPTDDPQDTEVTVDGTVDVETGIDGGTPEDIAVDDLDERPDTSPQEDVPDVDSTDGLAVVDAESPELDGFEDTTPDVRALRTNACGGNVALASSPGEPCGACRDGRWVCDGADALRCLGESVPNVCGTCTELPAAAGSPCGCAGTWECADDGSLVCNDARQRNACGGCGDLSGPAPGRLCNDGAGLTLCNGPNATTCRSGATNPCGGDGPLVASTPAAADRLPGEACGPCGLGTAACAEGDPGVIACIDEERGVNAAGTCGLLWHDPGEPCGCGGTWALDADSLTGLACLGESEPNACGGCASLEAAPGSACADGGQWVCRDPDAVLCAASGSNATACGDSGISTLGQPCGSCGDGRWQCNGREAQCVGASEPSSCGACVIAAGTQGESCGAGRVWVCEGDATVCERSLSTNRCGGGASLSAVPGEDCGACDSGVQLCISEDAVACIGEDRTARNGCGGCGRLDGEPGTPCGVCGTGRWACTGLQSVACEGENADARFLAYVDTDGDGFGASGTATFVCPLAIGAGYARRAGDCNDADRDINPDQLDADCDDVDDNCDGNVDEDGFRFEDADGDGFGNEAVYVCAPDPSSGYTTRAGDCYDQNDDAFPGQTLQFSAHRGDGSFDYNCDGVESALYPEVGRCNAAPFCWWRKLEGGSGVEGFYPTQQPCGGRSFVLRRCNLLGDGVCEPILSDERATQTCQ